jgi:PAS domain S-box-containing protein
MAMPGLDGVAPVDVFGHARDATTWPPRKTLAAAALLSVGYYLGVELGLAMTFRPSPVSALWPANAIVLAALLMSPTRAWGVLLLAVLPPHVIAEAAGGVPLRMTLCWYVSNCGEALLGAALVRRVNPGPLRFDTARGLTAFVVLATFLAPFLSSFVDAGFVVLNRWGENGYWTVWRMRFLSNMLAVQVLGPVILGTGRDTLRAARQMSFGRRMEAVSLGWLLLAACGIAFLSLQNSDFGPAAAFAPLPLLVWAAVRFGTYGVSLCLATVAFSSIWGAANGHGPFAGLSPAGNALSVQLFLILIALPKSILAMLMSERERAADKLHETQRVASLATGAARIGIWSIDLAQRARGLDSIAMSLFGRGGRDAGASALIHSADRESVMARHDAAWAADAPRDAGGDSPIGEHEYRIVQPTGGVRWVLSRGVVLRRPGGTPYRATGTLMDITDRKLSERSLRENDERMALAAAAANVGFWDYDVGTRRLWVTDQYRAVFGLTRESLLTGSRCVSMIHPDDRGVTTSAFVDAAKSGAPLEIEFRVNCPDGVTRELTVRGRAEHDLDGVVVRLIGVAIDVTERRRAEREATERRRELAHLARVATVNGLSGALAHELAQPLAAIMSNAQVASRVLWKEPLDRPLLQEILEDIVSDDRRGAKVIRHLRSLLVRDEAPRETLDIREVVLEVLSLQRSDLLEHEITVTTDLPGEATSIVGDHVQLEQVLLNLILNARDAMTGVPVSQRRLRVEVSDTGHRVRVCVVDSGIGIPRDRLSRIFDSFYTTKAQGLGLGLAICQTIIEDHGGKLWAASDDHGATLAFTLPTAGPAAWHSQS